MTEPTPADTLANIDAVLGPDHEPEDDETVSFDAMRSRPATEAQPAEVVEALEADWDQDPRLRHSTSTPVRATGGIVRHPNPDGPLPLHVAIGNPGAQRPTTAEPRFVRHINDLCHAAPVVLSTSQRLRAEFRDQARAELNNAAAWGEPKAVEVLASVLGRTPGGLRRRVMVYARALLRRLRDRLPRRRRSAMGGTITVDITPDVSRLREAFLRVGVSAHHVGTSLTGFREAVARAIQQEQADEAERVWINRWSSSDPAYSQLQEIAALADVHRHELRRWLDDHLDTVYTDLGVKRERPSVSEMRWRAGHMLRTVEEATRRGTIPMQVMLGFDGSINGAAVAVVASDADAAVSAQTSEPLTPVDEDQLIGYAHAPRVLATLRAHQAES